MATKIALTIMTALVLVTSALTVSASARPSAAEQNYFERASKPYSGSGF